MILQKISKVRWMASVQCLTSWGGEFKEAQHGDYWQSIMNSSSLYPTVP